MNRKSTLTKAVMLTAIFTGLVAGMLAPKSASAVYMSFTAELWPGGGGILTCGWHNGPCYDDDTLVLSGPALDWAGQSSITYKVRATMSATLPGKSGTGYVTIGSQLMCTHLVIVDLSDVLGIFQTGTHYLHTSNSIANGTTFNINSAVGVWTTTTKTLGNTATETGCGASWSGHHVHQIAGQGWTKRSYPDHTTCNVDELPVTNNVTDCWVGAGYKQGDRTWWLNFPF